MEYCSRTTYADSLTGAFNGRYHSHMDERASGNKQPISCKRVGIEKCGESIPSSKYSSTAPCSGFESSSTFFNNPIKVK